MVSNSKTSFTISIATKTDNSLYKSTVLLGVNFCIIVFNLYCTLVPESKKRCNRFNSLILNYKCLAVHVNGQKRPIL